MSDMVYEAMVRWMFLQEQGIDPTMAYNGDKPYGDAEWAIDRELAWKHHGHDAHKVLDAVMAVEDIESWRAKAEAYEGAVRLDRCAKHRSDFRNNDFDTQCVLALAISVLGMDSEDYECVRVSGWWIGDTDE